MPFETILFDIADNVATLTLNRPDKLNAFTAGMHVELREAMNRIRATQGVRALLITGAGRGFCAGQDLSERAMAKGQAPVDLGSTLEANYNPLILGLRELPFPVVCAVNGVAAGAGCGCVGRGVEDVGVADGGFDTEADDLASQPMAPHHGTSATAH